MIRPLLIDNKVKAQVQELVDWAAQNHYRPGKSETIPGCDPRHVIILPVGYRCVFSFTVDHQEVVWRHLSISVPQIKSVAQIKYPNPIVAFNIATLFGFTGYYPDPEHGVAELPKDWALGTNKEDYCIVLAQPL